MPVLEIWPNAGIPGELSQELPMPAHFEQAAKLVTEETIAGQVVCGPDAERHVAEIQKYVDAGFDHVYIHQIGPDQEGLRNCNRASALCAAAATCAGAVPPR